MFAEKHGPIRFRPQLVPPGPQAPGEVMQLVLTGEPDGSMQLVRDLACQSGGLAAADLGYRHGQRAWLVERRPPLPPPPRL
ncbi:MAG: hypothetical protein ACYDHE_02250 [Candidatus Acidiferrales bacterium]